MEKNVIMVILSCDNVESLVLNQLFSHIISFNKTTNLVEDYTIFEDKEKRGMK